MSPKDKELIEALKEEHRKVVAEYSGNMGGHVAVREGNFSYEEETQIEDCKVCDLITRALLSPKED